MVADSDGDELKTARLDRERSFHDERFADEHRGAVAKYYGVDSGTHRYIELVRDVATKNSRVLEYGCGTGSRAFELADQDAAVVGIDLSGVGIEVAAETAVASGRNVSFVQMDAERLAFAPESFDVVCGSAILHHLDLRRALDDIRLVLDEGGSAVFYEPLGTNPAINLYRRLTPGMRTPDEHPLVPADFVLMEERFSDVTVEYHNFLSLAGVAFARVPRFGDQIVRLLQRLDTVLFRRLPVMRRFAWVAVIRLRC